MTSQDPGARRARKFGHLRSLVHGPQTPGTWLAICALLGGWPAEELEEVLVYVSHGLRAWPASIRVMPSKPKVLSSWLERPVLWRLVGALRLNSPWELERHMDGDWSGLEQLSITLSSRVEQWSALLARWGGVGSVTSLELSVPAYYRFDGASLLKLLSTLSWRLTALTIDARYAGCDEDISDAWSGAWLKGLKRLDLSLSRSLISTVYEAIKRGAFGELEVFYVRAGVFHGLQDVIDAPLWSGLEALSYVSSEGWAILSALSRAGATPRMLELQIGDEDERVRLLSASLLARLEHVKIAYSPVLAHVLPPMVEHAPQLKSLTLHSGQLLGEPPPSLTGLAQLEELSLISTVMEASWGQWFVSQGAITRLKRLQLFHHTLASTQMAPIIEALYEPGEPLTSLSLSYCGVNAQSLLKIVDSGRLEQCEQLVLSNNSFRSQDRVALMDLFLSQERLPALKALSFAGNFNILSEDDVRSLKARFNSFVS